MNMNLILEQFIARYFDKKLMPGIRENVRRLFAAHPSPKDEDKAEYEKGKDYYVNSFGFQTEFMMRYMLMAFVAVSAALLVISAAVNREALEGFKIFALFTGLCLVLWIICKMRAGFMVYAPEWLYVQKQKNIREFLWSDLKEVKVSKSLTLIFEGEAPVVVPLEGSQYVDCMKFLEKHCAPVIESIPPQVYEKAMRKHAASWGNHM